MFVIGGCTCLSAWWVGDTVIDQKQPPAQLQETGRGLQGSSSSRLLLMFFHVHPISLCILCTAIHWHSCIACVSHALQWLLQMTAELTKRSAWPEPLLLVLRVLFVVLLQTCYL